MGIHVDIQGVQNAVAGERGIPRYIFEYANSLETEHPGLVSEWSLNPDLPIPPTIEPLLATNRLRRGERFAGPPPSVYHITSPFELGISLSRLWPHAARGPRTRLVVTVYDLIPLWFPDHYLKDQDSRLRYMARLELVRSADLITTISRATAKDVVDRLGVSQKKIAMVGTGVSERFHPPINESLVLQAARARVKNLRPGFLLYSGGNDHRKNVDGLLAAYAQLPAAVRAAHQLVLVSRVTSREQKTLEDRFWELGIYGDVLLAGYVPDDVLLMLYQTTHLFVFPSLYEGFGLPVAEAMACGAPVIAGDNSSLADLVPDVWARFDAESPTAIAETLRLVLIREPARLQHLRAVSASVNFSWKAVGDAAASVYRDLVCQGPREARRRPRVAYVSPMPPARSGVAHYSERLLPHLASRCDVHVFAPHCESDPSDPVDGILPLRILERVEPVLGGFDRVIYTLGNSEHHCETLSLIRRRPGVVIAHDVRLVNAYIWKRQSGASLPPSYAETLDDIMSGRLPDHVQGYLSFGPPDYYRLNQLMLGEVLEHSEKLFTHSPFAAAMAILDNPRELEQKIDHLPYAFPERPAIPGVRHSLEGLVISSFGALHQLRQSDKLVESFILAAKWTRLHRFLVIGEMNLEDKVRYEELIRRGGVEDRVHITGWVSDELYKSYLLATDVGVQLRDISNGETSGAMTDCLASGIPLIATEMGAATTLPRNAMLAVDRLISASDLALTILALADDQDRRASMHEAALGLTQSQGFEAVSAEMMRRMMLDTENQLEAVHLRQDRPMGSPGPRRLRARVMGD